MVEPQENGDSQMTDSHEELKNKGNEEFKKGNYSVAINYYT